MIKFAVIFADDKTCRRKVLGIYDTREEAVQVMLREVLKRYPDADFDPNEPEEFLTVDEDGLYTLFCIKRVLISDSDDETDEADYTDSDAMLPACDPLVYESGCPATACSIGSV